MCERCTKELAEGRITLKDVEPGIIVHHKKHITPENINNPRVTLSFDNLELLCARHHNEEHKSKYEKRYRFDEYGNIIQIERKSNTQK